MSSKKRKHVRMDDEFHAMLSTLLARERSQMPLHPLSENTFLLEVLIAGVLARCDITPKERSVLESSLPGRARASNA